jgi:alcohol dehydrogenase
MKSNFTMMTKINTFLSPSKIIFGNGAVNQTGAEVKRLGAKKALIITDKVVIKAGLTAGLEEALKKEKIDYGIYDKVEAEPRAWNHDECAQVARDNGHDILIGIGGGSPMDVAKGASILVTNGGKILDYTGTDMIPKRGLLKILVATTAGTGSEVTRTLTAIDETDDFKKAIHSDFLLSDVAIVDPTLTVSMPTSVTADTGVDALVHAIETYVSFSATPFSDVLGLEAIRLIAENLRAAYTKPNNMEARFNMSLGATLAGMAFASGGLGIIHGLSNLLGVKFRMSHGRSNAVMLPYVVDYNRIANAEKFAEITEAMGVDTEGLSAYEAAEELAPLLFQLLEDVQIPTNLSDYGVSEKDIDMLVDGTMKISRLFVPNPRVPTEEDIRDIFTQAL